MDVSSTTDRVLLDSASWGVRRRYIQRDIYTQGQAWDSLSKFSYVSKPSYRIARLSCSLDKYKHRHASHDLYIYLYAYTNKVSDKLSSKSVFFLLLLLLFTTLAHVVHTGDTSRLCEKGRPHATAMTALVGDRRSCAPSTRHLSLGTADWRPPSAPTPLARPLLPPGRLRAVHVVIFGLQLGWALVGAVAPAGVMVAVGAAASTMLLGGV